MAKVAFIMSGITSPGNYRELYVSKELEKRGHSVVWLNLKKEICQIPNNFRTIDVQFSDMHSISFIITILRILIREKIDIVWISGWRNRYYKYVLAEILIFKLAGIKIVYDPVDPIYEYLSASSQNFDNNIEKIRKVLNFVYRLTDITFAVTPELRALMLKNGAPDKKIQIANFGTNFVDDSIPIGSELVDRKEKFLLGWLGSMSQFKGIEEVFLPTLYKLGECTDDVCMLIGGKGPLYDKFVELKNTLGERVDLIGNVDYRAMHSFTKALHVYVIPLGGEDEFSQTVLPIKLFDALVSGTPIIITETPTTLSFKEKYKHIILAKNTPEDLYEKIIWLKDHYHGIKKAALNSREQALSLTQKSISKSIVDKIEDVIPPESRSSFK